MGGGSKIKWFLLLLFRLSSIINESLIIIFLLIRNFEPKRWLVEANRILTDVCFKFWLISLMSLLYLYASFNPPLYTIEHSKI